MPQPPEVGALADDLVGMFRAAQTDIENQLLHVADGSRRAVRLRELNRTVTALLNHLETEMRTWVERSLPSIYQLGASDAAAIIGDSFVWSEPHLAAIQQLASTAWDDLLRSTRFVRRDTKAWIRNEARQQATLSLLEGRTARQAGAALANAAGSDLDLFTVTYKSGARVRLADYAEMALRTTTAQAFADGTIVQSRQSSVEFMECADGDECGLNGHDDPEKPNGKLYPIDTAGGAGLSHPNCRRSWIPRPDATSRDAVSLRTDASREDQRLFEQVSTSARSPRQPRTPRAARGSQ